MDLTENHVAYIRTNLEFYGIQNEELSEDLLDHICTCIENDQSGNFEESYQSAIQKLGGYRNIKELQREANAQKFAADFVKRKKYVFGSISISLFLITTGVLFKIMHWPFASIILFIGFLAFLFLAVPLFFRDRYKSSIQKIN